MGYISEIPDDDWCFLTSAITDRAVEIAKDLELDIDTDYVTSRRIGRTLGKMRLQKEREGGTGKRMWRVTWNDLERWTVTHAIPLAEAMKLEDFGVTNINTRLPFNVTNVTNVTMSQMPAPPWKEVTFDLPGDTPLALPGGKWQRLDNGAIRASFTPEELEIALDLAAYQKAHAVETDF